MDSSYHRSFGPGPLDLQRWVYVAAAVGTVLILLLLLVLLALILTCRRKKKTGKKKQTKDNSEQFDILTPDAKSLEDEPIYAEIGGIDKDENYATINSLDAEVVGIEVVANESYAMVASNSIVMQCYGTLENDTDFQDSGVDRNWLLTTTTTATNECMGYDFPFQNLPRYHQSLYSLWSSHSQSHMHTTSVVSPTSGCIS